MSAGCDLCGDTGTLHMASRCHPSAPLRAELADGVISLYCYVPSCNRLVTKMRVIESSPDAGTPRIPLARALRPHEAVWLRGGKAAGRLQLLVETRDRGWVVAADQAWPGGEEEISHVVESSGIDSARLDVP